jgi:hypothetical protein
MRTRRDFLSGAAGLALLPYASGAAGAQGTLVNDIHSQLYFDALVFKSNDEILSHHRGRNCPVHSSKIHRQCLRWVIHVISGACRTALLHLQ